MHTHMLFNPRNIFANPKTCKNNELKLKLVCIDEDETEMQSQNSEKSMWVKTPHHRL